VPLATLGNGIRMAYDIEGNGNPVLLIAALGRDRSFWGPQVSQLKKYFTCITYDQRGTGESEHPKGPYSMEQLADDAIQLIDTLGIKEKIHVVGYSMGSAVAQALGLRYQDRIKSLVLAASWAESSPNITMPFETLISLAEKCSSLELEKAVTWWIFSPEFLNQQQNTVETIIQEGAQNAIPSESFISQTRACIAHHALGELHRIHCPCLIVGAERDRLIAVEESLKIHEQIRDSAYVCVRGVGSSHGFAYERMEEFNEILLEFLKNHND
jgi:pimeloyl-ACP methyl ester carboxylesterase